MEYINVGTLLMLYINVTTVLVYLLLMIESL